MNNFAEYQPCWPRVAKDDSGIRRDPEICAYCRRGIGHKHRSACVIVEAVFAVSFEFQWDHDLKLAVIHLKRPWSWSFDHVLFHLNESSWCVSNLAADTIKAFSGGVDVTDSLKSLLSESQRDGGCLCFSTQATHVELVDSVPRTDKCPNEDQQPDPTWRTRFPSVEDASTEQLLALLHSEEVKKDAALTELASLRTALVEESSRWRNRGVALFSEIDRGIDMQTREMFAAVLESLSHNRAASKGK